MDSKLDMVFNANTIKQKINNGIDTGNPATAKTEADNLMAKYDLEITAVDKTDYEQEILDTTAAAQKAASEEVMQRKRALEWMCAALVE